MIEELKKRRYKFNEQITHYNTHKNKLSSDEKFELINRLVEEGVFAYLELIGVIVFDIAELSKEYIWILEKITEKVKNDLAQGPFLNSLRDIGTQKEEIAIKLYNKIIKESENEILIVLSGLILGGYSAKNDKELLNLLKKKASIPILSSYLKAILVVYDKKRLPQEVYTFLDKIEKSKEEKLLVELSNISLAFFNKNKKYFYDKILNLIKLKNNTLSGFIFSKLSYLKIIKKEQRFTLIGISKDSKEHIIDEMLKILKKYPRECKRISELMIYWLNRDLEFKLKYFDWVLEDLSKENRLFIKYFLDNFKKIKNGKCKSYIVILPHLFVTLSKHHISYAIKQIFKLNLKDKDQKYLFYELNGKIIGNIYQDSKYFNELISLIKNLRKITNDTNFITFKDAKFKEKSQNETKENYDYLVNIAYELLRQLRNRKKKYDFPLIRENLQKYPQLYLFAEKVIDNSESRKRYSPLLWLGETKKPDLSDINISENESELNKAFKLDFARSKYWSRAYLEEINGALKVIEKYPNGMIKKQNIKKDVIKKFGDEANFWRYFSELVFIKKFDTDKKIIKEIEPKVPYRDNYLDLKINLFKRDIYFEVTQPDMDRSLRLANGAVGLGNKAFSAIDKKYRQMFAKNTLEEIKEGKRKDIFFVVLDRSFSTIDEHMILNSFLGSLAYTWQIDKKTGNTVNHFTTRMKDSLSDKNKNTGIISGVIYFKRELIFVNKEPKIKLSGDIIQNPDSINKLTQKEMDELKKIIFN